MKTGITVYQQMPLVTLEDMTLFRPIKDKHGTSQEMDSPTKVRGRTFKKMGAISNLPFAHYFFIFVFILMYVTLSTLLGFA